MLGIEFIVAELSSFYRRGCGTALYNQIFLVLFDLLRGFVVIMIIRFHFENFQFNFFRLI